MRSLILIISLASLVALAGCGGGGGGSSVTATVTPTTTTTALTAAAGGTATNGTISVVVPAGALSADTSITVTPILVSALPAALGAAQPFVAGVTLGPSGTTFTAPVKVTLPLPAAKPVGSKLTLLLLSGSTWLPESVATVDAGGLTATADLTHFSSYVLTTAFVAHATKGYILGTATELDGGPNDFYYAVSEANKVTFNHGLAKKVAEAYDDITAATASGYTAGDATVAAGDVFMVHSLMPGETNSYYKLKVLEVTAEAMTFAYEPITAPPLDITGTYNIEIGTVVIAASGSSYQADLYDSASPTPHERTMTGTLSGTTLSGTWERPDDPSDSGTFEMVFSADGTTFTLTCHQTGGDIVFHGTKS